jgi:hypothetical protein
LGAKQYHLCSETGWKPSFVLLEGEHLVGKIYSEKGFRGDVIAELPADLSLPVKMFMLWLVMLIWNQDDTVIIAST